MPISPTNAIDSANALAASQFVALVLALVFLGLIVWLYVRALRSNDHAWEKVGELTSALKDSNTLIVKLLDGQGRRGNRS